MRSPTNRQLLLAVVVLAGAATLAGLVDVVQGARARGREAELRRRVWALERDLEDLRARMEQERARGGLLERLVSGP